MRGATRTVFSRSAGRRVRFNSYNKFKRDFQGRVAAQLKLQNIQPVQEPVYFVYCFYEPNKRRDPSNFTSSGQKLIEDALVSAGVIQGDGWKDVLGFHHYWVECHSSRTGVAVHLGSEGMSLLEAVAGREGHMLKMHKKSTIIPE